MFETSVVRARGMSAHHRYRLLTLSLTFHGCAIVAAIAATLASSRLPEEAPRQMSIPILIPTVALPPALGTPHPKPAAPVLRVIPETTSSSGGQPPSAVPSSPATDSGGPLSSTGTGTGTRADAGEGGPGGVPGGIGSGTAQPESVPLHIGGDVKAPVILQRVIPEYPRAALIGRMNGWVIVECIIDKTGHIRDARVVKSSFAAFEQPALDAVQKWVFTPGSLHGEPVDTIFDLTVTFQLR